MAKVITSGIQKGGAGKTATWAITTYMLAQAGNKVLAIDLDSQGNLTEILTQQDIENFAGSTSLTAMQNCRTDGCIYRISDNLDIMPAEVLMATFSRWLCSDYKGKKHNLVLKETIDPIRDNYDYIVCETFASRWQWSRITLCGCNRPPQKPFVYRPIKLISANPPARTQNSHCLPPLFFIKCSITGKKGKVRTCRVFYVSLRFAPLYVQFTNWPRP